MKLEARGKYAGVKIHLNEEETQEIIASNPGGKGHAADDQAITLSLLHLRTLKRKIIDLMKEKPNLLLPRTEEEVNAELVHEFAAAKAKLIALDNKLDWTKVKVEVDLNGKG